MAETAANVSVSNYLSQAFGLRWRSDWPNPWFADAPDDGRAVDVEITRRPVLDPRPGGRRVNRGELFHDGTRFAFEGAVIDMYDGRRIRWFAPGADQMPIALFSTVAAHLLAWRGLAPLHASAVSIDGQAILIAGASGAGKSTLASALIERGAHLVSDDLSVLQPCAEGDAPMILPGRPAIRLVERMGDSKDAPKLLAWPPRIDAGRPVPLRLLLLLQHEPPRADPAAAAAALIAQQFRPTWMRALPNAKLRTATLFHAAQRIGIAALPPASAASGISPWARADEAMNLFRQHLKAHG